jgi:hypothetical protein
MQKQRQQRVSRQPINFIPENGSVRVAQGILSGIKLILLDFIMFYGFVRLPKAINPTVRVMGSSLKLSLKTNYFDFIK